VSDAALTLRNEEAINRLEVKTMQHGNLFSGDVSELIRAFVVENDEAAYEQLGRLALQRTPQLIAYAKSRGVPDSDVEDLVQDAFWDALKPEALATVWRKHGEQVDLDTHLFTKLRGRISTYTRKRQRRPRHLSLDSLLGTRGEPTAEPSLPALDEEVDSRALFWQAIYDCLQNDLDLQILWLATRTTDDSGTQSQRNCLTLKQVAQMLCISHDNARYRWSQATKKLRNCPKFYRLCLEIGLINDGGKDHA
jgi:RNA polymerase sigma factor (sigma-70 family)